MYWPLWCWKWIYVAFCNVWCVRRTTFTTSWILLLEWDKVLQCTRGTKRKTRGKIPSRIEISENAGAWLPPHHPNSCHPAYQSVGSHFIHFCSLLVQGKAKVGLRDVLSAVCWYLLLEYCTDNRILYGRWIVAGPAGQYLLSRRLLHNIASLHITFHCNPDFALVFFSTPHLS